MIKAFNKKIVSIVTQNTHFLGEGKESVSSTHNAWSHALLTSKIKTLQTIGNNIFLIKSSKVLIIEICDCSLQTDTLYATISQEIIYSSEHLLGFFALVIAYPMGDGKNFYFLNDFYISARILHVQSGIQMSMNLTQP